MKQKFLTTSLAALSALLVVWGVFVVFEWGEEYFATRQSSTYEELPFEFKLKSTPEDVIFSEAYTTASGMDIVKYAYVAGEVPPLLDEEISLRTPNSQTVVLETWQESDGTQTKKLKTTFLSKPQFYQKDGEWKQIEYATTTPEIFAMSGAIPYIMRRELVERLLPGKPALAITSTFYPNPNTETTSVDGTVQAIGSSFSCDLLGFENAHGAGTGSPDDAGVSLYAATLYTDNQDCTDYAEIQRAFILFDTSSLTAAASISSATISIYITSKYTLSNDGYDTLHVDATTPTSNTAIQAGDYGNVATVSQSNTTADVTSLSTGAYTNFTLNSTGLGNISKTGISKYGIREGHDFFLVPPASGSISGVQFSSADTSGTSQDPKLEVTYTAGGFSFGQWFPF